MGVDQAVVVNLSKPEFGMSVVRVVVPGLEGLIEDERGLQVGQRVWIPRSGKEFASRAKQPAASSSRAEAKNAARREARRTFPALAEDDQIGFVSCIDEGRIESSYQSHHDDQDGDGEPNAEGRHQCTDTPDPQAAKVVLQRDSHEATSNAPVYLGNISQCLHDRSLSGPPGGNSSRQKSYRDTQQGAESQDGRADVDASKVAPAEPMGRRR